MSVPYGSGASCKARGRSAWLLAWRGKPLVNYCFRWRVGPHFISSPRAQPQPLTSAAPAGDQDDGAQRSSVKNSPGGNPITTGTSTAESAPGAGSSSRRARRDNAVVGASAGSVPVRTRRKSRPALAPLNLDGDNPSGSGGDAVTQGQHGGSGGAVESSSRSDHGVCSTVDAPMEAAGPPKGVTDGRARRGARRRSVASSAAQHGNSEAEKSQPPAAGSPAAPAGGGSGSEPNGAAGSSDAGGTERSQGRVRRTMGRRGDPSETSSAAGRGAGAAAVTRGGPPCEPTAGLAAAGAVSAAVAAAAATAGAGAADPLEAGPGAAGASQASARGASAANAAAVAAAAPSSVPAAVKPVTAATASDAAAANLAAAANAALAKVASAANPASATEPPRQEALSASTAGGDTSTSGYDITSPLPIRPRAGARPAPADRRSPEPAAFQGAKGRRGPVKRYLLSSEGSAIWQSPTAGPLRVLVEAGNDGDAAVAAVVQALTSPPAQVCAAALRSLASDIPTSDKWHAIDTHISDLDGAVARAAAAAAAAAVSLGAGPVAAADTLPHSAEPPTDGPVLPRDITVPTALGAPTSTSGGQEQVADAVASNAAPGGVPASFQSDGGPLLWPLLVQPLQVLAGVGDRDGGEEADAAAGTSPLEGVPSSTGQAPFQNCSREQSRSPSCSAAQDDHDPAAIAAASALLEVVSVAILDHGIFAVRNAVTRLRGVAYENADAAVAAAERDVGVQLHLTAARRTRTTLRELLVLPQTFLRTASDALIAHAPRMSARQMVALLAVTGALALRWGARAEEALFARAFELVALGAERTPGQEEGADATGLSSLDSMFQDDGSAGTAVDGATGAVKQEAESRRQPAEGNVAAAAVPRQRRLPPPLTALLLLLLPAALPAQLSRRRARWQLWWPFRSVVLGRRDPDATQRMLQELGAPVLIGQPPGAKPQAAEERARAAGDADDLGLGEQTEGTADIHGEALPLVAVGALLAVSSRLQLRLQGTPVEGVALQRVAAGARGLRGRHLVTLLHALAEDGVLIDALVLDPIVFRLDALSRDGYFTPGEVVRLAQLLSCQAYVWRRSQLAGMLSYILDSVAAYGMAQALAEAAAAGAPPPALPEAIRSANARAAGRAERRGVASYNIADLIAACAEIEALLGQLQLPWAVPERLTELQIELGRFVASGGARPIDVFKAWRAFTRTANRPAASHVVPPDDLDSFIANVRREITSGKGPGDQGSMLERILAIPANEGVETAEGQSLRGQHEEEQTRSAFVHVTRYNEEPRLSC